MSFADIPEHAVYLEDRRAPFIESWEWVTTLDEFITRVAQGVEHVSLDYSLEATDAAHNGMDAVQWMAETDNWPSKTIQLHTGDSIHSKEMGKAIMSSSLFTGPEEHPLGDLYRRISSL